jgi:hypothetical protein
LIRIAFLAWSTPKSVQPLYRQSMEEREAIDRFEKKIIHTFRDSMFFLPAVSDVWRLDLTAE